MIKRILKVILVPTLFILTPVDALYCFLVWIVTGKPFRAPLWWCIIEW
jgi:hypothetical protein